MKKVLALVLAAVMALSLATVLSAAPLTGITPADYTNDTVLLTGNAFYYGEDAVEFFIDVAPGFELAEADHGATYGNKTDIPSFYNTGDFSLSVSATSDNKDVTVDTKLIKNIDRDAVAILVTIKPIAEKFTVAEEAAFKVKVKVVQKEKNQDAVTGELEFTGDIQNTRAIHSDAYADASGNYFVDAPSLDTDLADGKNDNARVIDVSVFEKADGKALTIDYDKYAVKFAKVSKQNTSLYLYAKTGVVSVTDTKAIGSIAFQPTRVKDAATITMPISFDNQNFYGETVYVYNVVDGKPTGEAIAAEVVNHNSIVFTVPAGTALGTFAAYGAKTEGDAEKPAIPETGANDIVNIAIVFAVVALAAAGFVAVKKASK